MKTRHLLRTALLLSAFSLQAFSLSAQRVTQPDPQLAATGTTKAVAATTTAVTPKAPAGDIVQMDVFKVTGEQDDGYGAANTTSALGIRTPLSDVASSISAFTPEFLADIGASTVEDILNYAGNGGMDLGDNGGVDMNTDFTLDADNTPKFNIRGMPGSVLVNGVPAISPTDQYNMDRVEIAQGANSILFGMGAQGGVLAISTGDANLNRNTLNIKSDIGIYDSPGSSGIPYRHFTMNYNLVLIPRELAIRLYGLYEDSKTWRMWEYQKAKRINPVIAYKPWQNTTIKASYEAGQINNSVSRLTNTMDGYTRWAEVGSPIMQGFGSAYSVTRANTGVGSSIAGTVHIFNENNDTMYNYTQAYEGTNFTGHPLDPSLSPFEYSTLGPGGGRDQKLKNGTISIAQTIGDLSLQLSYNYQYNNATALGPKDSRAFLKADPNSLISPAIWVSNDRAFLIENPYAGGLYMEDAWIKRTQAITQHNLQLNAVYSLNLKQWGRHMFSLRYEFNRSDLMKNQQNEILVDDNNMAIDTPDTPESNANNIARRNYITVGDYSTYHSADPTVPVSFSDGTRLYRSAWVSSSQTSAAHIKQDGNSVSLAIQSYWFNDRLSTIIGGRYDIVNFQQEWPQYRIDPSDPRVTSGQFVANEFAFDGKHWISGSYKPFTFTAGAVYKIFRRASLAANYSTNRGMPILDGRRTLPDGNLPPLTQGTSADFSIRYDFFGDGKLVARAGYFNSRQMRNASYVSITNLGANNLFNIMDALYFLTPTGQTGIPNSIRQQFGAGPGAGPMPASMYAINPPVSDTVYPYGSPPQYSAGMIDTVASGYEFELTGKPMKNLDVRLTFSYTDRARQNIASEVFDYYNKNIPIWMDMANSNNPNSTDGQWNVILSNTGNKQKLADYIWDQLYGVGNLRDGLATAMLNQTGNFGNRPYKANLTVRYTFNDGWFKGFAASVSARYRSGTLIPDRNREAPSLEGIPDQSDTKFAFDPNQYYNVPGGTVTGRSDLFWDLMFRYKCKILGGRTNMTIQTNLKNLGSSSAAYVARWNTDGTPRNWYMPNPRKYTLTVTFDF